MKLRTLILLSLVLAGITQACKVPVFRYALERWESDAYEATILYRGADRTAAIETLATPLLNEHANLEVSLLDIESLTEAQQWQVDGLDEIGDEPVLRLGFPHGSGLDKPFWEGPLAADSVSKVTDSPLRQKLVQAILEGSSTTWVLLETSDAAANDAAEQQLRTLLDEISANLELPEGVVRAKDVTAEGTTPDGKPLEMDDVLRTEIPLKISFPIFRLSPSDPAEAIFASMLRPFARSTEEPVAIPIFGRGRALEGIPASALSQASIAGACDYLCGECSCQVKDQNPGIDLLLAVDWNTKLQGTSFIVERELPALSGFGVTTDEATTPTTTKQATSALPRTLVYTMGTLLGCVLLGTYLINRRHSH